MREELIKSGIDNLKEFGYPEVNEQNILTDMVYGMFFEKMLIDNLGVNHSYDDAINSLLDEIRGNRE